MFEDVQGPQWLGRTGLDGGPGADRAQPDLPAPPGPSVPACPAPPLALGQVLRGRRGASAQFLEGPTVLRETTGQAEPHPAASCPRGPRPGADSPCSPHTGERAGLGSPAALVHAGGPLLILFWPRGWGRRAQPVSALCAEDTGAAVRRLLPGPVGSPAALGVLRSWRTMISSPPGSHRDSGALSSRVRADPALLLSGAVALPCLQHHPGSSPLCPRAGLAAPPGSHCALSL